MSCYPSAYLLTCTSNIVHYHSRFDQARLIRHNRILAQNGIDPSGENAQQLSSVICAHSMGILIVGFPLYILFQACRSTRRLSLGCDPIHQPRGTAVFALARRGSFGRQSRRFQRYSPVYQRCSRYLVPKVSMYTFYCRGLVGFSRLIHLPV